MSIAEIERALDSLEDWPGYIGIMGGEPTVHPQFVEICQLLKKRGLRSKVRLFTMGGSAYEKNRTLIKETFHSICYNPHNFDQQEICLHQPITLAIQDVVKNKDYRDELISNCWAQKTWCPTIGQKGGFFCEVAFALDLILDGPGGYMIEPGWWNKTPKEFKDQVKRYCRLCGLAVPVERELIKIEKEKISPGLLALFKKHRLPRLSDEDVILFDRKLTIREMEKAKERWDPGNYRQDIRSDRGYGWKTRNQPGGKYKGKRPPK